MSHTSILKTRAIESAAAWPSDRIWNLAHGNPVLASLPVLADGNPVERGSAIAEAWCDARGLRFLSARVRPNERGHVVDLIAAPRTYTIEVRR